MTDQLESPYRRVQTLGRPSTGWLGRLGVVVGVCLPSLVLGLLFLFARSGRSEGVIAACAIAYVVCGGVGGTIMTEELGLTGTRAALAVAWWFVLVVFFALRFIWLQVMRLLCWIRYGAPQ